MRVVKSELINGRVSIILMINEANNKHYVLWLYILHMLVQIWINESICF